MLARSAPPNPLVREATTSKFTFESIVSFRVCTLSIANRPSLNYYVLLIVSHIFTTKLTYLATDTKRFYRSDRAEEALHQVIRVYENDDSKLKTKQN